MEQLTSTMPRGGRRARGGGVYTLQEHQLFRTFAIYQAFLTLPPLTLGSMEKSFFYHLFCVTQETYLSKDLGEIYI